jgi:hypothetical protein
MPSGSNENNDPGYTYPDATRTPTPTPTRSAALPANPNVVAPPAVSPTAAGGGQQTPVNELPGVQRLPNTGSGGLAGGSFQFSAMSSAALVLLLGVILAGSGIILTLRRRD